MNERDSLKPGTSILSWGPVARSSVVDAVADRLRNEILSGRIAAGSRLPSERELSLALGVNRLTLRASLARLEALGLITTRHGAGTVVTSWRERAGLDMLATLVKSLTPDDPTWYEIVLSTLEIRRILATEAIALAAERHDDKDLETIIACKEDLLAHVGDPIAYAKADLAFMRAVVRAARNLGLELLLNTFARMPDDAPELVAALWDARREGAPIYDVVIELIRSRDAAQARALARGALEELDQMWMRKHAAHLPRSSRPPPEPLVPEIPAVATPKRAKKPRRQKP